MSGSYNRRAFLKSSLLKTSTGIIALNELLGPGLLGKGVRLVSAEDRLTEGSLCEVLPASVTYDLKPTDWTLTYTAGQAGLPMGWALVVVATYGFKPEHNLKVTSSYIGLGPMVSIKSILQSPRVIWIQPGDAALPPGETITITLDQFLTPRNAASCAFNILEMNPQGKEPELGSGLTFYEVPVTGGKVLPASTTRLNVVLPTRCRVNDPIRIKISAMDRDDYATPDYTGTVYMESQTLLQFLPDSITFGPDDQGSMWVEVIPMEAGILRVEATDGAITSESNPCICTDEEPTERIFWGDYHHHSFHDDGNLTLKEIFDFAKRTAFLDWGMVSPHDMPPFPSRGARNWGLIKGETDAAHEDQEFVTFQGYEWSHHGFGHEDARGHKVVIYLEPAHLLPLFPYCYSEDPLQKLPPTTLLTWLQNRAGKDVIVIPHHLPIYKWWRFPEVMHYEIGGPMEALSREEVDRLQPVAEVFSGLHGNNEALREQNWIKPPTTWEWGLMETFWQDGLKAGVRSGAVCGSDNHRSGLGHPLQGAKTAVLAKALTREGIFRAIQNRRTYGTSGPRVFIDFTVDGAKMGEIVTCEAPPSPRVVEVNVISPEAIDSIEIVRVTPGHAEEAHTHLPQGARETSFTWTDSAPIHLQWVCYYLRIRLNNSTQGAWTSPIWQEYIHKPDTQAPLQE